MNDTSRLFPVSVARRVSVVILVSSLAACSSNSAKSGGTAPEAGSSADAGNRASDAGKNPVNPGSPDGAAKRFEVTTKGGVVMGSLEANSRAFLGIPYAAPPTGPDRWRSPKPRQPWTAPRDATLPPKVCPQNVPGGGFDPRSDEDCLVVNVFAPEPPPKSPVPVMVWIHGGAYVFGSGVEPYYSGSRIVEDGNVVFVGVNYRLGALGFLSHPALTAEDEAHPTSGNYGFEDQQAALRWVKDNIAAFGGDPGKVTIFGESAGAHSVCLHLAAPGSAGLFHRAISESGPCNGLMDSTREAQYARGEGLARAVGCDDAATVLDCLRARSPAELVAASPLPTAPGGLFHQGRESDPGTAVLAEDARGGPDGGEPGRRRVPFATFRPVQDDVIVPAYVGDGKATVANVPLLLGTNRDEATLFTTPGPFGGNPVRSDEEYRAALERTFGVATAKVLARYPSSAFATPNDALNELTTDAFFVCPTRRLARETSGTGLKVYLYAFMHAPERPLLPGLGAFHAAELGFVFGTTSPLAAMEPDELPLATTMRGYWTRFANAGDPNGGGSARWPEFTANTDQIMQIDLPSSSAREGYKNEICDFWDGALE